MFTFLSGHIAVTAVHVVDLNFHKFNDTSRPYFRSSYNFFSFHITFLFYKHTDIVQGS